MNDGIQQGAIASRRYRRPFAHPLKAAWGTWSVREGLLHRLHDPATGQVSFFEQAPLPSGAGILPASKFWLAQRGQDARATEDVCAPLKARTAGLLSLDPMSGESIERLRNDGYRTYKLKLGISESGNEWSSLQQVIISLEPGEKLRLDPNRSWDADTWGFWKPRLNGISEWIEFLEEPFKDATSPEIMLRRAEASPVTLALDESLNGGGVTEWLERGWPGYWIIKPTLLGDPSNWRKALFPFKSKVVLSSVFETGIGLSRLIQLARDFPDTDHGLGTQAFFGDDFGVPQQGAVLTALTIEQQEDLWKRLPGS